MGIAALAPTQGELSNLGYDDWEFGAGRRFPRSLRIFLNSLYEFDRRSL